VDGCGDFVVEGDDDEDYVPTGSHGGCHSSWSAEVDKNGIVLKGA
jgi:hypothetical protein